MDLKRLAMVDVPGTELREQEMAVLSVQFPKDLNYGRMAMGLAT